MEKRIIEINGVKLEVDLRHAVAVESYKVGDKVKVLRKGWSDSYTSHVGVIVGFDAFQVRPTIIIAYLKDSEIEYLYYNSESKDCEICMACDEDLPFTKERVLEKLHNDISKKQRELEEAQFKVANFERWFGRYFEETKEAVAS